MIEPIPTEVTKRCNARTDGVSLSGMLGSPRPYQGKWPSDGWLVPAQAVIPGALLHDQWEVLHQDAVGDHPDAPNSRPRAAHLRARRWSSLLVALSCPAIVAWLSLQEAYDGPFREPYVHHSKRSCQCMKCDGP